MMTEFRTAQTASVPHSGKPAPALFGAKAGLAIECSAVRRTFRDGTVGLAGLDLRVEPGSIVVLLGPSGCGKTTLLRCMAGLEPLTSGSIEIGGVQVRSGGRARQDVALVFQNYALYPSKTGFQNIEFPLRMAKVPRATRHARVQAVADMLGIKSLLERGVSEMSGGQRQRVGIGRALIRDPAVLLMDEPLSNLDAELRTSMRAEIKALQRRLGTTLVFVTHDQAEALALADDLVVMRGGVVEQAGAPEHLYSHPASSFVAGFLGAMNLFDILSFSAEDSRYWQKPPEATRLGLRPEDVRPGPGMPEDFTFTGIVTVSELLGRDRLLHLQIRGVRNQDSPMILRARTVGIERFDTGDEFVGHVAARNIHYFDAADTRVGPGS